MQKLSDANKKLVGIITGGWCGPEVIDAATAVLQVLEERGGMAFSLRHFQYDNWEESETNMGRFYNYVEEFYQTIRAEQGAILRGSLHAPIVYKLREAFDQSYKLVSLKYCPELVDSSLLKKEIARKIDLLLMRENNHGPYHATYTSEPSSHTKRRVFCEFYYDEQDIDNFATTAFSLANKRARKLHLCMKSEALGEMGELWLQSFSRAHEKYPEVKFVKLSMGNAAAEIFYKPKDFDVIATPDVEGDILADSLTRLLYGSMMLTPSGNFSPDGFVSYQTIHGTVKPLAGKDKVNPIGMIHALAMYLEHSAGMEKEADIIRNAVRRTLAQRYRTMDIYRRPQHKLVGTREMTQQIIANLQELYPVR